MAMASRPNALKIPKNVAMSKTNLQQESLATFIPIGIFPVQPVLLYLSVYFPIIGFVIYLTVEKNFSCMSLFLPSSLLRFFLFRRCPVEPATLAVWKRFIFFFFRRKIQDIINVHKLIDIFPMADF